MDAAEECILHSQIHGSDQCCHMPFLPNRRNSKHKQGLKVSQLNEDNDEAKIELSFKMEDGKVKVMQKNQ